MLIVWLVLRACKGLLETFQPVLLKQLQLVEKSTTIAASHDLAVYQGIQVMDQPVQVGYSDGYDTSEEAEARREAERLHLDPEQMNAEDNERLASLF